MRGWIRLFGSGTLTLRCLSVLFSACSLIVLYILAVRIGGRRLGIAAALCFGLSFYYLHLGIYVRPYALAMLLSLLSVLYWQRLLDVPESLRKPRYFWGYTLTVIGGLYTIYHFAFVFAAEGLLLVCKYIKHREQLPRILLLFLIVGIACLPWIGTLLHHIDDVSGGPYYFYGDVRPGRLLGLFATRNFAAGVPLLQDWPLRLVTGAAVVLITAAGLLGLTKKRKPGGSAFL
jgi:4-amino-4-deoxy-L-arabinose transferase-like glycosyltransferase